IIEKTRDIILEKARALLAEKSEQSLKYFEECISDEYPESLKEIGFAYLEFSQNVKALDYLIKYHDIKSNDTETILEISQIYYFLRDFEKSIEFLLIYENTKGADRLVFLKNKALNEEALGRFKEAETIFSEVLKLNPEDLISFEHIVMLYENADKQIELLEILLNREKIYPLDLDLKKKIGKIYLEINELKKARVYFGILVENNYYDRDFIQDYLELSVQYKDYEKAETIALKLIDSGSFRKDELALFFTKLYFKTGRINLAQKYAGYIEHKQSADKWKNTLKTLNTDNIFTLYFQNDDKYSLKTMCSGVVIDKVDTEEIEIVKNYLKDKEQSIVIYANYEDILISIHNKFDIEDFIKLIHLKKTKMQNIDDMLDIIKQITSYFEKRNEVFRAFLSAADDKTVKILLFFNKFLNISLSSFSMKDFLLKEWKLYEKETKINLNISKSENSVFREKNIWYNYLDSRALLSFFESHSESYTGKSVIFVENMSIANKNLSFTKDYEEFSFYYGNYICLNHFEKYAEKEPEKTKKIIFWLPYTETGSLNEINIKDSSIEADERNCMQLECPYYEKCFFQRVRKDIFNRKYVVSDFCNKDYFKEKFERAFYFITPNIIEDIVQGDIYSFSKNTCNINQLDSFLENILVNSQESFNFYRKIKESIIKIIRLEERIIKIFKDSEISSSLRYSIVDNLFSDFSVFLKRYINSIDTLSEDLYDIEKFVNPVKANIVEINFQRNRLNNQKKLFHNITEENSDYWVSVTDKSIFLISNIWNKDVFKSNIYVNCYENIRKISTFISALFDVNKIIDIECEMEKRKEFSVNPVFIDRIGKYSPFIINYLYSEIEEKTDNTYISKLLSDNSKVRDNIKDLFNQSEICIKEEEFLKLLFAMAFSGKTTVLYTDNEMLKQKVFECGISCVEIYKTDTDMEKKLRENLIKNKI
ncbi:MAG: hypothetical protein M0Q02_13595, partial [Candidatus Muirbacterium halophilum]|nr:hypothetical protein [Candidatus Muirbacterium halophilum]